MSLVESLASLLRGMTLGELALALLAVLAYSIAINNAYSVELRHGAGSVAFAASVGFTTLTPSWMSAVVFLALAVVAVAAFAGCAWLLSSLLGLGQAVVAAPEIVDSPAAPIRPAQTRGFAPHTSAQPL